MPVLIPPSTPTGSAGGGLTGTYPNPTLASPIVVDNLSLSGNSVTSTSGALNLTPVAGSACVIDGHFSIDGSILTAITDNNTVINAYSGKNITIEGVTFDGGVITTTSITDGTATLTGGALTGLSSLAISINDTSVTPQLSITQSGIGDAGISLSAGGSAYTMVVDNSSSDRLIISNPSADFLNFTPDGNLGINVLTPQCRLQISAVDSSQYMMKMGRGSGGNPAIVLSRSGVEDFVFGMHIAGSNKFKISRGETLGTNDLFSIEPTTGIIAFGTHTAIGAETVTGYITIKDIAGTTRKLAIVS